MGAITLLWEASFCWYLWGKGGDVGNRQLFLTPCVAAGVDVPLAARDSLSAEIHPASPVPVLSKYRFAVHRALVKAGGGRNGMRLRVSPSFSTQVVGYFVPAG